MQQVINEFKNLKRWEHPQNYAGETYEEYFRTGIGQSRDSDVLEKANFVAMLEKLGGESETVIVTRSGHWAVGWVESILIHESDKASLAKANEIMDGFDDYPVIDDSIHSEMEHQAYSDYADSAKESVALVLVRLFGLPEELAETKEMLDLAYELNMQEQFYGGEDHALFNNEFHLDRFEDYNTEAYIRCLKHCENMQDNPAFHLICACFGIESK